MWKSPRLTLIADAAYGEKLEHVVLEAVAGGVDAVIFRGTPRPYDLESLVTSVKRASPQCLCLVNGPVDWSNWQSLGLDGLHLPFAKAMGILGSGEMRRCLQTMRTEGTQPTFKLGVSVHSLSEWVGIQALQPDYLLISNCFETSCKPGVTGKGPDFVQTMRAAIPAAIPLIGLGGITHENMNAVMAAGLSGIAVRSALCEVEDPRQGAQVFLQDMAYSR